MKDRNSRQTFLGEGFLKALEKEKVALVGLGGGGSLIAASLVHIGFKNFFICDPDDFEESNINRLLGAHFIDIESNTPKIEIISRMMRSVEPGANITSKKKRWQDCVDIKEFQESKIIFSCLDDFSNRIQIESFARKNGIVLIDIGFSIKEDSNGNYHSMGQIVLSHPDGPCFKCLDFITDKDLETEASKYGDVGSRPQVIWANSILANTAIGLSVEILSEWTGKKPKVFYKHFDGNTLELYDNFKAGSGFYKASKCEHYLV